MLVCLVNITCRLSWEGDVWSVTIWYSIHIFVILLLILCIYLIFLCLRWNQTNDWLIDDWLIDWLIDGWIDQLIDCLIEIPNFFGARNWSLGLEKDDEFSLGTTLVVVLLAVLCLSHDRQAVLVPCIVGDKYNGCVGWSFLLLTSIFDCVHQWLVQKVYASQTKGHIWQTINMSVLPICHGQAACIKQICAPNTQHVYCIKCMHVFFCFCFLCLFLVCLFVCFLFCFLKNIGH